MVAIRIRFRSFHHFVLPVQFVQGYGEFVNAEFLEGLLAIDGNGGLGEAGSFLGRPAGAQKTEHLDLAGAKEGFRFGRSQDFILAEEVDHMARGLVAEDAVVGPDGGQGGS